MLMRLCVSTAKVVETLDPTLANASERLKRRVSVELPPSKNAF
jgi:hypothetical protein